MIINIRGTHGSGKSTIVRKIMELYDTKGIITKERRKRPMGYALSDTLTDNKLFVPGHYETPCGGCDSISVVEDSYAMIHSMAGRGIPVLFEGILAQHYAQAKFMELRKYPTSLVIIALTTPLEECIASVNMRRAAMGKPPLPSSDNIAKEFRGTISGTKSLEERGVKVHRFNRFHAEDFCRGALGWPALTIPA